MVEFDSKDLNQFIASWIEKVELLCCQFGVKKIEDMLPMYLVGGALIEKRKVPKV